MMSFTIFLYNRVKTVISAQDQTLYSGLPGRPDSFTKNTYATPDGKFYTSLNGTKVRSKSEQFIADWLYRHNVPFEYEPLLQVADFPFRPDFYIPAANLYIEHVSDKSFPIDDKENQFNKGGIMYVKTHEEDTKDSAFFSHHWKISLKADSC